tara:strand:- start:314 stop:1483 length:1170 start_codon:yes stop_codon:yes gene_type:complete
MTDIPEDLNKVDERWLTEVLTESHTISHDNKVVSITKDTHGAGLGYLSEIERINVNYAFNEGEYPEQLIAKFPTPSPKSRALATLFDSYQREVLFYRDYAPDLDIRTPRCYWADIEEEPTVSKLVNKILQLLPDTVVVRLLDKLLESAGQNQRRSGLLLEDLSSARVGDQVEGCDVADAEAALRSIAKFHSAFWGQSFDDVDWIHPGSNQSKVQHGLFMKALPAYKELFADLIDETVSEQLNWLIEHGVEVLEKCSRNTTLIHGDFRLDNIFFQSDGSDPILIDFQTVNVYTPMTDVAYFLLPNLHDDNQDSQMDLVRYYWEKLTENGVSDYSWEDCLADYELAQWWLIHRGVILIGLVDFSHPRGGLLIETAVRRGLKGGLASLPLPW